MKVVIKQEGVKVDWRKALNNDPGTLFSLSDSLEPKQQKDLQICTHLRRHDFRVRSRNLDPGVQTRPIMSLHNLPAFDSVSSHSAVVRALEMSGFSIVSKLVIIIYPI